MEGPFSSLESAHEYVTLLGQQVREVRASILEDITIADGRRLDALRIVDLKLSQLDQHLAASGRALNDLRALRRLLLGEREGVVVAH
jgi:hypothetical protein